MDEQEINSAISEANTIDDMLGNPEMLGGLLKETFGKGLIDEGTIVNSQDIDKSTCETAIGDASTIEEVARQPGVVKKLLKILFCDSGEDKAEEVVRESGDVGDSLRRIFR